MILITVYMVCLLIGFPISAATYPYQDPNLSIEERVTDLLARMTLAEKAGQMIQTERHLASPEDVKTYCLGSIFNGGGNVPSPNTPTGWCEMIDAYQKAALETRLQIPFLYGTDAVHGHNNVKDATIFPHNIGLGATRDPDLVERIGQIVAREVRATGVHWTFAPCVAVPQNEKWGRTYEGFSEETALVSELGAAFVKGVQGADYHVDLSRNDKIAACLKHYLADGATEGGIDAGNALVNDAVLRLKHLPPYLAGIAAGARTVMVSFNQINGVECHANGQLITDVLKKELKFDGIVVSDYNGIDDNDPSNYRNAVKLAVNAGIDMIMTTVRWKECLAAIIDLTEQGEIDPARIDDAVRRILRVKFQLGLFEKPYTDRSLMASFGSEQHRRVAREAVRKSLVLLKNDRNLLPLAKSGLRILVAGKCADNIGYQCGGWTITWQGLSGQITAGTSILQGIKNVAPGNTITYRQDGSGAVGHDVAIVVIGETPYAESNGDHQTLALDYNDLQTLRNVKDSGVPTIVVLISGRPLMISDYLKDWAALVAAWLPGSEGQGVAEVLFGDYNFSGKLPFVWPQSVTQIPIDPGDGEVPLFPLGTGLSYLVTPTATVAESPSPSPTSTVPVTPIPTPIVTVIPSPTQAGGSHFTVAYTMNDWGSGATVNVTVKNNGTVTIDGWELVFSFPGNQKITNLWCAQYTQSGATVTVTNETWNSTILPGGTVSFGFNLNYSGSNVKPTAFTLNGAACQIL